MSNSVKGIFKVLIVIAVFILLGALIINVFVPNLATAIVNSVEGSIYRSTGLSFDINGDGTYGKDNASNSYSGSKKADDSTNGTKAQVNGAFS